MIQNIAQMQFPQHRAHISRDGDQIIVFKYDGSACDFQTFTDQIIAFCLRRIKSESL
jgi:hypothetical protein